MSVRTPVGPPYRCPKCDAIARAEHTSADGSRVTLHFCCPYCDHRWTLVRPAA